MGGFCLLVELHREGGRGLVGPLVGNCQFLYNLWYLEKFCASLHGILYLREFRGFKLNWTPCESRGGGLSITNGQRTDRWPKDGNPCVCYWMTQNTCEASKDMLLPLSAVNRGCVTSVVKRGKYPPPLSAIIISCQQRMPVTAIISCHQHQLSRLSTDRHC